MAHLLAFFLRVLHAPDDDDNRLVRVRGTCSYKSVFVLGGEIVIAMIPVPVSKINTCSSSHSQMRSPNCDDSTDERLRLVIISQSANR